MAIYFPDQVSTAVWTILSGTVLVLTPEKEQSYIDSSQAIRLPDDYRAALERLDELDRQQEAKGVALISWMDRWPSEEEWAEGDMVTVWVSEETGPHQRGDRLSVTPMEACGWESSCRGWCMEWGLQNLLAGD